MTPSAAFLEDRGVVRVSGEDAASFLQGLLTNDVETLEPGEARYAGLLTPQGKILFDMIVVRVAERRRRRPSSSTAPPRRRPISPSGSASTSCAPRSRSPTRAPRAPSSPSGARRRGAGGRGRLRRPARSAPRLEGDPAARGGRRLRDGAAAPTRRCASTSVVPKGGVDFAYGDAFPHDANFDLLNGVDFQRAATSGRRSCRA